MSDASDRHARACMAELVKEIERDPIAAHEGLSRAQVNRAAVAFMLGVLVATVFLDVYSRFS